MRRRRLDEELVRRGLASTPGAAREAIDTGRVTLSGRFGVKAETLVAPSEPLAVHKPETEFASRGGDKLAGALDRLQVDPSGRHCLDAGASSGGFTDVLLSRGADHVIAVDVGYGQLAWNLRTDDRVTVLERTNARDLTPSDLAYRPDLITADLSFISLAKVVPDLVALATHDAELVLLVKPQFEAPQEDVSPGGVVLDPAVWKSSVEAVARACEEAGAGPVAVVPSPLPGPAGNVEFFLHARGGSPLRKLDLTRAVAEGEKLRQVKGEAS